MDKEKVQRLQRFPRYTTHRLPFKQDREEPRAQKIHTHQQKKLSILSFPPLSPSSLHSFTCSSTLVITTTINHMISAVQGLMKRIIKKGALVRGKARGVLLRPTQHPFCGSLLLQERGGEREKERNTYTLTCNQTEKDRGVP